MQPQKTNSSSVLKKILFGFLGLLLIGVVVTFLVFNFTYSEGNRAGVIIKFSKKGYVFKTFEGELNIGGMGNIPNTAQLNQIWEFSVKDRHIADTLMGLEGRKVSLHYTEKVQNLPWQGETKYFVDGVTVLEQ
jgi:hypothetical protein